MDPVFCRAAGISPERDLNSSIFLRLPLYPGLAKYSRLHPPSDDGPCATGTSSPLGLPTQFMPYKIATKMQTILKVHDHGKWI
jgi:hypothetical protein